MLAFCCSKVQGLNQKTCIEVNFLSVMLEWFFFGICTPLC